MVQALTILLQFSILYKNPALCHSTSKNLDVSTEVSHHCRLNVTHFTLQCAVDGVATPICRGSMSAVEQKTETLNLRVSPKLKAALRSAARREHRSMANMIEHLVLRYCEEHGLIPEFESEGVDDASLHT